MIKLLVERGVVRRYSQLEIEECQYRARTLEQRGFEQREQFRRESQARWMRELDERKKQKGE